MINRLLDFVTRYPVGIVIVVLLLTVAAVAGMFDWRTGETRLLIDPSVNRLLPEADEDRRFYEHIRRVFGSEDVVMVAVARNAPDGVFNAGTIARIAKITAWLQELPEVY